MTGGGKINSPSHVANGTGATPGTLDKPDRHVPRSFDGLSHPSANFEVRGRNGGLAPPAESR